VRQEEEYEEEEEEEEAGGELCVRSGVVPSDCSGNLSMPVVYIV
jgi:hypothetical protein